MLIGCLVSRTRTLFMDHLEQHLSDSVNSAIAIVTNRKETLRLKEELQLKQLDRKYIQRYICHPRLGNTHTHTRTLTLTRTCDCGSSAVPPPRLHLLLPVCRQPNCSATGGGSTFTARR